MGDTSQIELGNARLALVSYSSIILGFKSGVIQATLATHRAADPPCKVRG
jgi:hypothetical protein